MSCIIRSFRNYGLKINGMCINSITIREKLFGVISEVVFIKMPSRQEKKRAKRRAKYLEVRDDVLESARASYKADPEKKRTGERERYHADPVKKRSAKRKSYDADPEKKRSAKRESYEADPEKKRSAKRESYKADPEKKRGIITFQDMCLVPRRNIKRMRTRLRRHNHVGDRVPILYRWKEMKMEKQRYNSHWV